MFAFLSCGEDRDIISKDSNNCIVVECGGEFVNEEQEKEWYKDGTLR